MIEVENLLYKYKNDKELAIDSLSFDKGKIYGLLGCNGVGKTTLLSCISGLCRPRQGRILIDGNDVSIRRYDILKSLFFLPDKVGFSNIDFTIQTFLELNAPFYPCFNYDDFFSNLSLCNLSCDNKIATLTDGEQKKMMLSFAFATNTPYLLIDEPTKGLDMQSEGQFRKLVALNMNEERSLIIATNQVSGIENLLDHVVILLKDGSVFNHSVETIANKIRFTTDDSCKSEALYQQPITNGYIYLCPNYTDDLSALSLEAIFNAVNLNFKRINDFLNER